ncbi:hypothetical protein MTO96_049100 [Rhipicephalus appendiculatus]
MQPHSPHSSGQRRPQGQRKHDLQSTPVATGKECAREKNAHRVFLLYLILLLHPSPLADHRGRRNVGGEESQV